MRKRSLLALGLLTLGILLGGMPRGEIWNVQLSNTAVLDSHPDWVLVRAIPEIGIYTIRARISRFHVLNPRIRFVERDIEVQADEIPSDSLWDRLWGIQLVTENGKAFDVEKGSVTIAVIDTGVDSSHPDLLAACVWSYSPAVPCRDGHGHGTHVAGTIAGLWNGQGIVGVCPRCRIEGYKALSDSGSGSASAIAAAIVAAADRGAKVINLSLGADTGGQINQTMARAVAYARDRGVFVAAAAGNSGKPYCAAPANSPGVICVGAINSSKRRATFSNYGRGLDLVAPGVNILSSVPGGSYRYMSGTSMATPHVAGAAGLLYSHGLQDAGTVERALFDSAESIGDSYQFGRGLVNVSRALEAGPPIIHTPTPGPTLQPSPTRTLHPEPVEQLLDLINQERSKAGLHMLQRDERLYVSALRHSRDMQTNHFCGHYGSDGSSPLTRMRDAGYTVPYGETVACGYPSAHEVVEGWMNSSGHRAILLCRFRCTEFGAGKEGDYWTLNVGAESLGNSTPTPALPTRTPTRKPSPSPQPTSTPEGFWMWCSGRPLSCQERDR